MPAPYTDIIQEKVNAITYDNKGILDGIADAGDVNSIRDELRKQQAHLLATGHDLLDHTNDEDMINDAEAHTIQDWAREKIALLNFEKISAAITAADFNILEQLSTVADSADGDHNAIRQALQDNNPQLGGVSLQGHTNDTRLLSDVQAGELRIQAIQKRKELNQKQITDAMAQIAFDKMDVLNAVVAAAAAHNAIRQAIQDHAADLGGVDLSAGLDNESLLSNDAATAIQAGAILKRQELNAAKIKETITAGSYPLIKKLAAVAEAGDANAIRAAIHAHHDDFGVGEIISVEYLTDAEAGLIKAAAHDKRKALILEHVKEVIAATMDPEHLKALAETDATIPNNIRASLNDVRFGSDLTSGLDNENLLTDDQAKDLRRLAVQKRNELIITQAITVAVITDPAFLKDLAQAQDHEAIRKALHGKPALGDVNFTGHFADEDLLTNAKADEIKKQALHKFHVLTITNAINAMTNRKYLLALKDAANANAIRKALNDNKEHLGKIDLTTGLNNEDLLTDAQANNLKILAIQKFNALKEPLKANVLRVSSASKFTEEVVRKGETPPVLTTTSASITLSQAKPKDITYQGEHLHEGDKIYSRAKFKKEGPAGGDATGTLVQDHLGRVSDITPANEVLTEAQKAEMALKQVQMLLLNYQKDAGDIVIEGSDMEQANRVYAILLYMKKSDSSPLLQNMKIDCAVPGFEAPKAGVFHGEESVNDSFIKEHLPPSIITERTLSTARAQTETALRGLTSRQETIKSYKQTIDQVKGDPSKAAQLKKAEEQLNEFELKEGESVNYKGMKP